jgi:hypothetical protein
MFAYLIEYDRRFIEGLTVKTIMFCCANLAIDTGIRTFLFTGNIIYPETFA